MGKDTPQEWSADELKRAYDELVTKCAALETENARLRYLSKVDSLMQIFNRYGIGAVLEDEAAFAKRSRTPLSVIVLDVDRFKQINDEHGHLAGDAVLQELSQRLRATLRPYDKIGRWGGDELIVVLRGTEEKNAAIVAERLRKTVANEPFSCSGKTLPVTISLGVAQMRHGEFAFGLLEAADIALYDAKKRGGNCVVCDGHR